MERDTPASPLACEAIGQRLSDYVDGELDPLELARVLAHLKACPTCQRFACELAATVRALHQLGCCD